MVDAVCTLNGTTTAAGINAALDRFPASMTIPTSATCNPDAGVSMSCSLTGVSYPALIGVAADRWGTVAVVVPTNVTCNATSTALLLKTSCTLSGSSFPSLSTTTNYADRWGSSAITVPNAIQCTIIDSSTDLLSVVMITACFFAFVAGWRLGNASL